MNPDPRRIHSLDGLRAFSILLVVIGHVAGTVNAPAWLTPLHKLGNFGVTIFFVISGFLITHLLLEEMAREGRISLKGFYLRRIARIFPAFYFYILCVLIAHHFGYLSLLPGDLLHASTFTMNYHHERAWALNHTWSLAVEEQFYLLWPFALLALGLRRALTGAVLFLLAAPVIRAVMWYGLEVSPSAMTREFQAVGDALAAGCCLAVVYRRGIATPRWFHSAWFLLVPLSLFAVPAALYLFDPGLFYVFGQSYTYLAAAVLIWRCITSEGDLAHRILNQKAIAWLGTLSYSLYLWQEPFLNSWSTQWFTHWPVNLLLAFVCAVLSFYLVERPAHRFGKRFAKRKPDCKTGFASDRGGLRAEPSSN